MFVRQIRQDISMQLCLLNFGYSCIAVRRCKVSRFVAVTVVVLCLLVYIAGSSQCWSSGSQSSGEYHAVTLMLMCLTAYLFHIMFCFFFFCLFRKLWNSCRPE